MSEAYSEIFTAPEQESPSRFPDFWKAWPSHERKVARLQCESKWKAKNLDRIADRIIDHVERMKLTDTWVKNCGAYIPAPMVYLNQARWEAPAKPLIGVQSDDAEKTKAYLAQKAKERQSAPAEVMNKLQALRQRMAR